MATVSSAVEIAPFAPPGFPPEPALRLTVAKYHEMSESGVIREEDRLELLDGWLFPQVMMRPLLAETVDRVGELLRSLTLPGWRVRVQLPVTLALSEPQPDATIVCGLPGAFRERHPSAQDIGLVVEVADSSLVRDRGLKKRLYAEAGIPVYWIVNLNDRRLEVFSEPTGPAAEPDYRRAESLDAAGEVPLVLDGHEVARLSVGPFFV
jgi:Uma2 family endonuclease